MEFPDLMHQCSLKECRQIDFLPFECDGCHKSFCLEHKNAEAHDCEKKPIVDAQALVCPLCHQRIITNNSNNNNNNNNVDVNELVNIHINKGCPRETKVPEKVSCSLAGCKGKEHQKLICKHCHYNYCFRHRFPQDHKCHIVSNNNNNPQRKSINVK